MSASPAGLPPLTGASPTAAPLRVGLISLGCAKNLVDAEIILGSLAENGFEVTNELALADVVVVNTCGFIDAAKEESIDTILEQSAERDARRPGQALVVAGCLPQRYQLQLPDLLPEVDGFMGLDQVAEAPGLLRQAVAHRRQRIAPSPKRARIARVRPAAISPPIPNRPKPQYIPDCSTPRFRLTPRHFAYVKVAEGCNHPCSFCVIPRIRGSHRSRPQPDIVAECRRWLAEGVKELNLISQDTTFYGLDRRPRRRGPSAVSDSVTAPEGGSAMGEVPLGSLLRELNALPGDFWIRILYTHPAHWTTRLMDTLAACPKVARYVDVPLQHIHPVMLERMRRETRTEDLIALIANLRHRLPGIALRTTFIVGFPGETEDHFEALLDFIRTSRFERLGVFTFSAEEGTRAAKMSGQVPERLKQQRRHRAMTEQLRIARDRNQRLVGTTLRVLVEHELGPHEHPVADVQSWEHGLVRAGEGRTTRRRGRWWLARSEADAPDIDGRVFIRSRPSLAAGAFHQVRIIGHTDYDLLAEPG